MAQLFVGQLPFNKFYPEDLERIFAPYGTVVGRELYIRRGNGFVLFRTTEEADAAIVGLHGRYCVEGGRHQPIQVMYSKGTRLISAFGLQHRARCLLERQSREAASVPVSESSTNEGIDTATPTTAKHASSVRQEAPSSHTTPPFPASSQPISYRPPGQLNVQRLPDAFHHGYPDTVNVPQPPPRSIAGVYSEPRLMSASDAVRLLEPTPPHHLDSASLFSRSTASTWGTENPAGSMSWSRAVGHFEAAQSHPAERAPAVFPMQTAPPLVQAPVPLARYPAPSAPPVMPRNVSYAAAPSAANGMYQPVLMTGLYPATAQQQRQQSQPPQAPQQCYVQYLVYASDPVATAAPPPQATGMWFLPTASVTTPDASMDSYPQNSSVNSGNMLSVINEHGFSPAAPSRPVASKQGGMSAVAQPHSAAPFTWSEAPSEQGGAGLFNSNNNNSILR